MFGLAATDSARRAWRRLLHAEGPPAIICIRLLVGLVFLSEGIQKFLYPHRLGPGRFERIGIPAPAFFANLDGVVEIVCGTLVLLGLLTRFAAVPLLIDILGAIVLTKLRELQPGGFLGVEGFWGMAHDARTDLSMLLGLIFLLWMGPGRWSLDARLTQRRVERG
ncbi:putative membrane protein [Mycobacterium shinjukuense]|uniref:Putative membrane protein n=1 Tax=Mycobacterium shinjukuense TaxID=398694 RepID=A0A7I7MVA9_9MYCO|nr:putative membrane protein [Mycobacterium shinjukuense]